jgi:hypothetical protein
MSLEFWWGLHWTYAFHGIATFTILILLIHEHGKSFYLLMSSLISFFSDLWFSLYRYFTTFIKFIPRYFNSWSYQEYCFPDLSDCSLLVYKNATDFCVLICIQLLCWMCIWCLRVFGVVFRVF